MSKINIAGLDKAKVLRALYAKARRQGMGFLHYSPEPLSDHDAKRLIKETAKFGSYFDYLAGRVMKVELGKDSFDPSLYDRDNGPGAAAAALSAAGLVYQMEEAK